MAKTRLPALGAAGWFREEDDGSAALIGGRCTACANISFPADSFFCRNPACSGTAFEPATLSRRGTVWSVTDARYQPPPPYVTPNAEHVPFAIAAVELGAEQLVVLGQVIGGVAVEDIKVGSSMELVIDVLFEDDEHEYTIWKWRPVDA
ncbi:MAG: Zn-ribbon domain-containing OB-fold protein [Acidimicrobiales bacterium]